MRDNRHKCGVLVIGTGIAGCVTALAIADEGLHTTLICAGDVPTDGNTNLAQGGIVYRAEDDDPAILKDDILRAGWNINYLHAVNHVCRKGPDAVREVLLNRLNTDFNRREDSSWDMIREGGHSKARILHRADYSGRAIMDALFAVIRNHPNITVMTRRSAVDLLTSHHHTISGDYKYHLTNQCLGAYVLNQETGNVETMLAEYTVLATGGVGRLYLHTTNSASSIGSGLAMTYRAGVRIMNCEYVQFHPTALFHRAERRFLISEAMRGAGAKLVNSKREPFMHRYDSRGDLAPRDIVTRAIVEEMLTTGEDCVYLDAARYSNEDVKERFPTIAEKCREIGIDIAVDPIPVVPAAHYFCGGVLVDVWGRTSLSRLYAVGECSCTGIHGANRLASTSLLEGVLWGQSAGRDIVARVKKNKGTPVKLMDAVPDWIGPTKKGDEDPALVAQDWATIKNTMWNYVGIIRSKARLRRAFEDLRDQNKRIHDFYKETQISKPLVDLFHGCNAAYLITTAAMRNPKTVGCHYRVD